MPDADCPFREDDPMYECCCTLLHVKTGAKIMSVFKLVVGIVMTVISLLSSSPSFSKSMTVGLAVINVCASISMFLGIRHQSSRLVFPFILDSVRWMLFSMLLWGSFLLIAIVLGFTSDDMALLLANTLIGFSVDNASHNQIKEAIIISLIAAYCLVAFLIYLWQLRVSFQCYNYFLDKTDASRGVRLGSLPTVETALPREQSQRAPTLPFTLLRGAPNPLSVSRSQSSESYIGD